MFGFWAILGALDFQKSKFFLRKNHICLNLLEDVLEGNFFDQEARQEAEGRTKMSDRRGKCAAGGGLGGG